MSRSVNAIERERAECRSFMRRPLEWPRYPLLPVKKRNPQGSFPDCGLMVAGTTNVVYEIYLGNIPSTNDVKKWLEENAKPIHRYDDLEALLAAGWVVD